MKYLLTTSLILFSITSIFGQSVEEKLAREYTRFESDPQLKHATSSLYVIDANTGKVIFDKNSIVGLAPASTQKIITSVTAFELLGSNYRYKTILSYEGEIRQGTLMGNIRITGTGDPTFGSWRYSSTKEEKIWKEWVSAIKAKGIKSINGNIIADDKAWESQTLPGGWMWDDMGNYYGAGSSALNWRENQYDLILKPGHKEGDPATIVNTKPALHGVKLKSELTTGKKGSGDNAYIYLPPYASFGFVRGTIPLGESPFTISGSIPNPGQQFAIAFAQQLQENDIKAGGIPSNYYSSAEKNNVLKKANVILTHQSPSLDSIIFWFNRRSINLYGESLLKTISFEKNGFGRTDSGLSILHRFWEEKGIDENELNMNDGSGLSPLNRVTTHAQVEILKYARTRKWYNSFYEALPEFNGMKMKSGTISGVKGFCGYHRSSEGREYIFSFLVNNYNGRASSLVNKMYAVLNELK